MANFEASASTQGYLICSSDMELILVKKLSKAANWDWAAETRRYEN